MLLRAVLSVLYDLKLECPPSVGTCLESLVLETVSLGKDSELLSGLYLPCNGVTSQAGHVSLVDLPVVGILLDDPVGNLEPRVDQLDSVLGTLQNGLPGDLHQLVDIAEARSGLARCDGITDSVGINACPLALKNRDEIFIE